MARKKEENIVHPVQPTVTKVSPMAANPQVRAYNAPTSETVLLQVLATGKVMSFGRVQAQKMARKQPTKYKIIE